MKEKGIISKTLDGIKILGRGEVTKKLNVTAAKLSESAKQKIVSAGGKYTELIPSKKAGGKAEVM